MVACMRCGVHAADYQRLGAATPCHGWAVVLPARVAALLLLGDGLRRAGGPDAALGVALQRRRGQLLAPPD